MQKLTYFVTFDSPQGFYFVSGSHDRTVRLWSTDHIQPLRILAGHLSDVDVSLSPTLPIHVHAYSCARLFILLFVCTHMLYATDEGGLVLCTETFG